MYNAWDDALAKIQQQISPSSFNTWFSDTSILSNEDGVIIIGVKNTFIRNHFYSRCCMISIRFVIPITP